MAGPKSIAVYFDKQANPKTNAAGTNQLIHLERAKTKNNKQINQKTTRGVSGV